MGAVYLPRGATVIELILEVEKHLDGFFQFSADVALERLERLPREARTNVALTGWPLLPGDFNTIANCEVLHE